MATIIMALSSSFAYKAPKLKPPVSNNLFKANVLMLKTSPKWKPLLATAQPVVETEQPVDEPEQSDDEAEETRKSKKKLKNRPRIVKSLSTRKFLFAIHREIPLSGNIESPTRMRKKSGQRRNRRFFIRSRKQIHYKKIRVIGRFIGYQGKIIPRRVTKLTMKHQRLMTAAIKKARMLGFLPFCENEKHFRKVRWRQVLNRRGKKRSRGGPRRNKMQSQRRPFPN